MVKRRGAAALSIAGLLALAALGIWFGIVSPQRQREASSPPAASAPAVGPSADNARGAASDGPGGTPAPEGNSPAGPRGAAAPESGSREAAAALSPSFDVVRVEPNGDSVIAGRGAPGAAIEMLRNGELHARVMADASGLFALVPPPLPPGSSEIILQSIAPDGARTRSHDSVTVAVAPDLKTKPLVALTAPDKPTVVLSGPDGTEVASAPPTPPPQPAAPAAPADPGLPHSPAAPSQPPASSQVARTEPPPAPAPSAAGPPNNVSQPPRSRPNVRVESVETQGEGRLFVSGRAAPGATVRLYLNESLVAPGAAAPDGRFSFMIEKGVRPGGYAVRLDDVDPVSGDVRSRAEVEFTMPPPTLLADQAAPPVQPGPAPPPAPGRTVQNAPPAPAPPAAPGRAVQNAPPGPGPSAGLAPAPAPEAPAQPSAPGRIVQNAPPGPGPGAGLAPAPAPEAPAQPSAPGRIVQNAPPGPAPGAGPAPAPAPPTESSAAPRLPAMGASPSQTAGPAEPNKGETRKLAAAGPAAPVLPEVPPVVVPEINTAIIARGDNLWRISRRVYGQGIRYTVIYGANQPQIRNPSRIYPGQVFVLPTEAAQSP